MTDRYTDNWTTLDSPISSEATPDASFLDAQREAGATSTPSRPTPYSPQPDRKFIGAFLLFIGGMASLVTLALGLSSGVEAYQIHDRLAQWPHVEATVDFCETYYRQNRGADNVLTTIFGMRCHVTYTVGSRQWKSSADLGYTQNDREPMLEWVHRFHPGDRLEITYNPTFPYDILFAGDPSLAYAAPIWKGRIAFWCLLAAIVTLPFGFKLRSTQ